MTDSLFLRYFPVPTWLWPPALGIDISDQSIKWLRLPERGTVGKKDYGELAIPVGVIEEGKVKNVEALAQLLASVRTQSGCDRAVLALPEEQVYVLELTLPMMTMGELRGSIELQLEEHIPLPATDVVFDYEIYQRPASEAGQFTVAVSVAPKELVAAYTAAATKAGLTVMGAEIEVQSLARTFITPEETGAALLVDFGKTRTSFAVVSRGIVLFSSTTSAAGGENLTASLSRALSIDREAAEKMKIAKGILHSPQNIQAFEALLPIISAFRDEIAKHYRYWQKLHEGGEGAISKIIFAGGQASLPGFADYVERGLGVRVEVGNPWSNVGLSPDAIPPLDLPNALRYGTAIGLALRAQPR